jgi:hypothetical protein
MSDKHVQTSTTIQMMKLFQDNVKKVILTFCSHLEIDINTGGDPNLSSIPYRTVLTLPCSV